jgi:hypothetical protein
MPGSPKDGFAQGAQTAGFKTMAQERYNAEWLQEQGVGICIKLAIRAVSEIPEILNQILQARPCRDHHRFNSALSDVANI